MPNLLLRLFAPRKPLRRLLRLVTGAVLALYLPTCAVQILPQPWFWTIGILGIGFFYLLVLLVLLALVYLPLHKPTSLVLACGVLLGVPLCRHMVGTSAAVFNPTLTPGHLRIMQWNCMGMGGIDTNSTLHASFLAAKQMLLTYQPDVICLQDFVNYAGANLPSSIAFFTETMGYKHHCFMVHYSQNYSWGKDEGGTAIFSKQPLLQTGQLPYPGKQYPEGICWATLNVQGDTVLIASTHFQSMHLSRKPSDLPLPIFQYEDSGIINHGWLVQKLRHFQAYHAQQAQFLRGFLDTCRQPFVLAADLNSVPASYVYGTLKPGLQDAFLEKGTGLGGTYRTRNFGIRIDYLLTSPSVAIEQFSTIDANFYDHHPLVMDITLR
ncbi:MAG: hypothetical protein EAY75_00825 [Bacteroidetes bacterium]|nr:MAG: hypothetical protein EAY75_00825 [Bacteroidota bacterium]